MISLGANTPFNVDGTNTLGSHTIAAGDNIVIVAFGLQNADEQPSAVSYGGNAMTKAIGISAAAFNDSASIWYLVNPPSGSQTVTYTGSALRCNGAIASFSGVDTADPLDVTGTAETTASSTISKSLVSSLDGALYFDCACSDGIIGTSDAGQTDLFTAYNAHYHSVSYKIAGAAGSNSMGWTSTSNNNILAVAVFNAIIISPSASLSPSASISASISPSSSVSASISPSSSSSPSSSISSSISPSSSASPSVEPDLNITLGFGEVQGVVIY